MRREDDTSELGGASGLLEEEGQATSNDIDPVCSHGSLTSLNSDLTLTDFSHGSASHSGSFANSKSKGGGYMLRQLRNRHANTRVAVDNVHFAGHLLRRACGVTGKPPGHDGLSESQDSDSAWSLLEDSGEEQLMRLRRSPEMMTVLQKLKAFSVSLLGGGGSRGIEPIRRAQEGYLALFEEMLLRLLQIQRTKSKVLLQTVLQQSAAFLYHDLERMRLPFELEK